MTARVGARGGALRRAAIVGSGFVAATAVFGGIELLTGWPKRLPPEWLDGTPFGSYAGPGLLLGGLVGGSAGLATWAACRRTPSWPMLTAGAGAILLGWIGAEIALLNQPEAPTATEWVYAALGVTEVAVGALARRMRPLPAPPAVREARPDPPG